MSKTVLWLCHSCRQVDYVVVDEETTFIETRMEIVDHHKEVSPNCTGVLGRDLFSVSDRSRVYGLRIPEWAIPKAEELLDELR